MSEYLTDSSAEVLSPFLPGTNIQYAVDSTSIGYMKTCPQLYKYKIIDGWQEKDESVHLRFGLEYHQALQDYDLSRAAGINHEDALFDVIRDLLLRTDDFRPDHQYKNRDNLIRTVIWYLEKFKDDPAETFILENGKPAVELSFRFELDWGPHTAIKFNPPAGTGNGGGYYEGWTQPYLLSGHLDRVVNYLGSIYVMDRKTTKSQPSEWYFTQFEPDNQMSLYTLAAQVIFQAPVKGVIIDAAQIAIDFSRFGRGLTYRTRDQTEEWLVDLRHVLSQFESYAINDYWPKNDKACNSYRSEDSGSIGCPFRSICSKSPQVREQFLKSDFIKLEPSMRWNPLKSRG